MAMIDDFFNTGGDILDTVQEAVTSGDFSHLSDDIRGKVETAADRYRTGSGSGATGGQYQGSGQYRNGTAGQNAGQTSGQTAAGTGKTDFRQSYFLQTRPDKHGNIVKQALGVIGALMAGGTGTIFLFASLLLLGRSVPAAIISFIVTGVFAGLTFACVRLVNHGSAVQKLVERYYAYGKALGNAEYFSIKDLAEATGRTEDEVRKDIEDLRRESILPYAAMDRNKTTVMLTDRVYKQYQAAELSRTQREEAERKRAMREAAAKGGSWGRAGKAADTESQAAAGTAGKTSGNAGKTSGTVGKDSGTGTTSGKNAAAGKTAGAKEEAFESTGNAEVDSILKDGNAYIRKIHEVNDEIPDTEVMSDKLYRLENIMRKIFEQVRRKPESAKDLRRLMNYYLPTTTKLLDAYVDLYRQPETGENIRNSKQNIEDTMDIINDAFEKLFDNMFEDQAWDISSDINVMKTMMKQDGLAGDGQSFGAFSAGGSSEAGGATSIGGSEAGSTSEEFTDGFTDDLAEGSGAAVSKKKGN